MIACYAYLFDFRPSLGKVDDERDDDNVKRSTQNLFDLIKYIDSCDNLLRKIINQNPDLAKYLYDSLAHIEQLKKG